MHHLDLRLSASPPELWWKTVQILSLTYSLSKTNSYLFNRVLYFFFRWQPVQTASISFAKVEKRSTPEDPQDLTCQLCQRTYPRRESLTRHIQRVHKRDPYSCTSCSFQTRIFREFQLHKKMQHKVEKIHRCTACDFTSHSFYTIRRHMLTHTTGKVFRCDYCDFSSKRKQEVNRHVKNKHCAKQ